MSETATYTYTKAIKNVTLLMSTIYGVFGSKVDMYDYNPTTSALSVSFKFPITTEEKIALDTLVNIYIDSTILTPADVLAFKNISAYKSTDQVLPTVLNTVAEVTFKSTTVIDRMYYQMSSSGKYIYIQKPGIYFIMAKVGARLKAGSVAGTNSVLQWSLSYDDTRTEVAYIPIPNTFTYTLHTNANSMADSTIAATVVNINSVTGTYLRLSAKQTLGTTPLVIDNDQTSLTIMSIPGASFYEGNMTTALSLGTASALSNVNVALNTDRIVQYPFSHTAGSPNVTVNQNGYVIYLAKSTTNKTTGTDASISRTLMLRNGTVVPNVGAYSMILSAASNRSSSHFMGIMEVTAGDVFSMQGRVETGTSLQFTTGETGLILIYVHPALMTTMSAASVSSDIDSAVLSTSPMDIGFNKTPVLVPSTTAMTVTVPSVVVANPGVYLVVSNLTMKNPSGIVRECGIYTTNSVDAGRSFYYALGSLSIKQVNANRTTVSNMALLSMPENSRIKIQVATNGATTDNLVVTDTSQLTVINFSKWDYSNLSSDVYGDSYSVVTSPDDLIVSASTFSEKCRIIDHYMRAGVYRFSINICVETTTPASATGTSVGVQMIDIHSNSGNTFTVCNKTSIYPTGTFYFSSVDIANVAEGAHQFILQLSSPGNVIFTVKNALIETWRVI